MKNHITPPADYIAPPSFHADTARNGDVHNFHFTPYLPTVKGVCVLS